jgi:hypothetical protein
MPNRFDLQSRRRILKRWTRSGLSSHEFARQAGVSHATLYKWRREVGRAAFVEAVAGDPVTSGGPEEIGAGSAIQIGLPCGAVVQVDRDVDEVLLRRIVLALV